MSTVVAMGPRARTGTRLVMRLLGALTLIFCAAWIYATWWRADDKIIGLINQRVLDDYVGHALTQPPEKNPLHGLVPGLKLEGHPSLPGPERDASPQAIRRRGVAFIGSVYGWYALVTVAACLLGMAAGAGLVGRFPGRRIRLGGMGLALTALLGLIGFSALVLRQSQQSSANWMGWPVWAPRWAVVMLTVACLGLGMLVTNGGRGLHRAAAIAVLICALGSLVALHVATHYGGLHDASITAGLYGRVFALQALYPLGVLLVLRMIR